MQTRHAPARRWIRMAISLALALPGSAALACGGPMEPACERYADARVLGDSPRFALLRGGDKACRRAYDNGSAFLHATAGQCRVCPRGYRKRLLKYKATGGCSKIDFKACRDGLRKLDTGKGDLCLPRPPEAKGKPPGPGAAARLVGRAKDDFAANLPLVRAMAGEARGLQRQHGADTSARKLKLLCRINPTQATRALATGTGFTTATYEWVGDIQLIYGRNISGGYASYVGLDAEAKGHLDDKGNTKRYPTTTEGTSWGISAGVDGSYQVGFWRGEPADLAGESDAVTLAFATVVGASVSLVYVGCDDDCRLAGIVVAPQVGASAEGEVGHASTSVLLADHCAL